MRIGVLIDRGRLIPWQAEALATVASGNEFIVYDCIDRSRPRRSWRRHLLYYALSAAQARRAAGRPIALPSTLPVAGRHSFRAEADDGWDRLPESLLEQMRADGIALLVKFGLGLLRVPPPERLSIPILSYHHGDPRHFRGRPAGWWEMASGAPVLGQMVQRLGARLDGGEVLAFAETQVHPHSWKATLRAAYRVSPLLLAPAMARAVEGTSLPIATTGRNHRPPGNGAAARFTGRMAAAACRRLAFGLLAEKRWRIATAPIPEVWSPEQPDLLDRPRCWTVLPLPSPYRFLADPFFAPGGAILAEAMRGDGRGLIVSLDGQGARELRLGQGLGHRSYPLTLAVDGETFVLPEISRWSPPRLYRLDGGEAVDCGELDIPGRPRLLDPTLHEEGGRFYLFGNRRAEGGGVLRLWSAERVQGPYTEHPDSPILITPEGGRMGGALFRHGGALYRAGQDQTEAYGDGLCFFRVEEIGPSRYRERRCGQLRFRTCRGPHSLSIQGGDMLFDFYRVEMAPLAALRRLRQSRSG